MSAWSLRFAVPWNYAHDMEAREVWNEDEECHSTEAWLVRTNSSLGHSTLAAGFSSWR